MTGAFGGSELASSRSRSRAKEAANEFAQALLRNVMPAQIWAKIKSSSGPNPRDTSPEDRQRARAELSKEILADRSIADSLCALVPKELFRVLHPLVRARYWVNRGRWTEAEAGFKEALDEAPEESLDRCRILIERGRYFAARASLDDAARDFFDSLLSQQIAVSELAKDILANTAIRDRVFTTARHWYRENAGDSDGVLFESFRGQVFDAVFPRDPFAR